MNVIRELSYALFGPTDPNRDPPNPGVLAYSRREWEECCRANHWRRSAWLALAFGFGVLLCNLFT